MKYFPIHCIGFVSVLVVKTNLATENFENKFYTTKKK